MIISATGTWRMAAYDCGPGCVDHAVMRTGYADYWTLRRLNVLPKETANYVPVILAMTIMAKNAKDYGLENLELEPAARIRYDRASDADASGPGGGRGGASLSELRELNPALLRLGGAGRLYATCAQGNGSGGRMRRSRWCRPTGGIPGGCIASATATRSRRCAKQIQRANRYAQLGQSR